MLEPTPVDLLTEIRDLLRQMVPATESAESYQLVTVSPQADPAPQADDTQTDDQPNRQDVAAALTAYAEANGRPATQDKLRAFTHDGSAKLGNVPAEKYGAVIEALGQEGT